MKSHVLLLSMVLDDSGIKCCTSTARDLETITRRVKDEGLSFLTIALPAFAKDLERGLELGQVDSTLFVGYAKNGRLPRFLGGFVSLVFDIATGVLLDEPNVDAILSVRQICYLFHKLELPCTPARESAAYRSYIECEQSVRDSDRALDEAQKADFKRMAGFLFGDMFAKIDRKIYDGEPVPKHGPGATANRIRGNAKYEAKLWTDRLEDVFPAMDYLYTSVRHYLNAVEDGEGPVWLDPGSEPPVRVISVPKTLKTPRIIAIEPVHTQYVQQGLMEMIVHSIERPNNPLGQFIGFADQRPNRSMARHGSVTGALATLDLSEASDRVSALHVELLLAHHYWLRSAVFACRSLTAEVPGQGIIPLAKYASMGSALTFPLEAMVFLTCVFLGIESELNTQMSEEVFHSLIGQVRVYGDDILVPVEYVLPVIRTLEAFGLKVNSDKSFWTGRFRESCGGDYYDGYDVTVVRCRRSLPSSREHVQEIISAVSFRNQAYKAGLWRTAAYLDELLGTLVPMPNVLDSSPGLGRFSYLGYETQRECPRLQRPLVKAAVVTGLIPDSKLGNQEALLKFFLKRGREPYADVKHLERAGRPQRVNIKLRWVPPY